MAQSSLRVWEICSSYTDQSVEPVTHPNTLASSPCASVSANQLFHQQHIRHCKFVVGNCVCAKAAIASLTARLQVTIFFATIATS